VEASKSADSSDNVKVELQPSKSTDSTDKSAVHSEINQVKASKGADFVEKSEIEKTKSEITGSSDKEKAKVKPSKSTDSTDRLEVQKVIIPVKPSNSTDSNDKVVYEAQPDPQQSVPEPTPLPPKKKPDSPKKAVKVDLIPAAGSDTSQARQRNPINPSSVSIKRDEAVMTGAESIPGSMSSVTSMSSIASSTKRPMIGKKSVESPAVERIADDDDYDDEDNEGNDESGALAFDSSSSKTLLTAKDLLQLASPILREQKNSTKAADDIRAKAHLEQQELFKNEAETDRQKLFDSIRSSKKRSISEAENFIRLESRRMEAMRFLADFGKHAGALTMIMIPNYDYFVITICLYSCFGESLHVF
jgi:hypothetical protein